RLPPLGVTRAPSPLCFTWIGTSAGAEAWEIPLPLPRLVRSSGASVPRASVIRSNGSALVFSSVCSCERKNKEQEKQSRYGFLSLSGAWVAPRLRDCCRGPL
uniref:Uncharacterized protein n=1 Tax=Aegilops tauschii subsp. strangulata TaxID=200361 RepID=A0A452ZMT2_AEGTS